MTDLVEVLAKVLHHSIQPADPKLAAHACLTALEAAGYRVVPVELTEDMHTSVRGVSVSGDDGYIGDGDLEQLWSYLLAAAPRVKE